jgi:hypothetical protein
MELISDEYRKTQEELHATGNYGVTGEKYAPLIVQMLNKLEVNHLLDYGCGSNLSLARSLKGIDHKIKYQAYDPCVEKYSSPPVPAEMVACIDVLEHIEEDAIDEVLDHLMKLAEAVAFVSISTGPAAKTLSDGRNAHILQRPAEWWLPRLMCRFDLQTFQVTGPDSFYCVLYARGAIEGQGGEKLAS